MRLTSVTLILLTLPLAARAASPLQSPATQASPGLSREADTLLGQLDVRDYRVRERALARLVEIGPPARDSLERFVGRTDSIEARDRANLALQRIKQNEAL